jgi:hypothetical protein
LLNADGYTIRGVQQLLAIGGANGQEQAVEAPPSAPKAPSIPVDALRALRQQLADALAESGV